MSDFQVFFGVNIIPCSHVGACSIEQKIKLIVRRFQVNDDFNDIRIELLGVTLRDCFNQIQHLNAHHIFNCRRLQLGLEVFLAQLLHGLQCLEILVLIDVGVNVGFHYDLVFTYSLVQNLAIRDQKALIVLGKLGDFGLVFRNLFVQLNNVVLLLLLFFQIILNLLLLSLKLNSLEFDHLFCL